MQKWFSRFYATANSSSSKRFHKKSSTNKPNTPKNLEPAISWYPGHIAKAEKELQDYMKLVDVIVEVRDARILTSTTHPLIQKWIQNRPIIVAISRIDQATKRSLVDWKIHYKLFPPYTHTPTSTSSTSSSTTSPSSPSSLPTTVPPTTTSAKVYFLDGKRGEGIDSIKKQILKAGRAVNEKRQKLGIEPRPIRAIVIGYPNVGKSSLINRILNRKLAPTQNIPGFTRSIKWVRVSDKNNHRNVIELLDSPGIIPPRIHDQNSALFLAICNDIGKSAYDKQRAAVALCNRVMELNKLRKGYVSIPSISARYRISFHGDLTGEEIVTTLAENSYQSDELVASEKLLGDFRRGYWGLTTLECPPNLDKIDLELKKRNSKSRENREVKSLENGKDSQGVREGEAQGEGEGEEEEADSEIDSDIDSEEEDNEYNGEDTIGIDSNLNESSVQGRVEEPEVMSPPKTSHSHQGVTGASDKGKYDGW